MKDSQTYWNALLESYRTGSISNEDRFLLEKRALEDPFLFEALEGLHLEKEASDHSFLGTLDEVIQVKEKSKLKRLWMPIAASFAILLAVSTLLNKDSKYSNTPLAKVEQKPTVILEKTEKVADYSDNQKSNLDDNQLNNAYSFDKNASTSESVIEKTSMQNSRKGIPSYEMKDDMIKSESNPKSVLVKETALQRSPSIHEENKDAISDSDAMEDFEVKGGSNVQDPIEGGFANESKAEELPLVVTEEQIEVVAMEGEYNTTSKNDPGASPKILSSESILHNNLVHSKGEEYIKEYLQLSLFDKRTSQLKLKKASKYISSEGDLSKDVKDDLVVLEFSIDENGEVDQIWIIQSMNQESSEEAERILRASGKWEVVDPTKVSKGMIKIEIR